MTDAENQSAAPQPEHGTQPTPHSDGPGPTPSEMWSLLVRQAEIIERLVCQNQDLMAMAMGEQEQDAEDDGHGVDMAGNPIRVS